MRLNLIQLTLTGILCSGCWFPGCLCEYQSGDEVEVCELTADRKHNICVTITLP